MAKNQTLAELQVQLSLQSEKMEAGIKQVDRQLKTLEKQTERSNRGFGKFEKTLGRMGKAFAALGIGIVVNELQQAAREAIAFGDNIAKTADKVGVSVEELQQLRFAAQQSGVDIRQLDMGLQRFARRMGEAAQGTGELLKTTQELGIQFQDSEGRYYSTVELLEQFADAIGNAGTQQEKLRLAFKAFDSEGAALVNLFRNGSEEMKELADQAENLGIILSEDLVRESEVINDKFNILTQQIKVSLSGAFIEATSAALAFFDVFTAVDPARVRLGELQSEIEALEERLSQGRYRGSATDASRLQILRDEKKALEEQIEALEARDEKIQTGGAANVNALTRQAEAIKKSLNPLLGLQEEIESIQKLVGNGLTQEQAWLAITAAVEKYNEAVNKAAGGTKTFNERVEEALKANDVFNNLADTLGVLYEALQRAEDAGNFAQADSIFNQIADLELGGATNEVDKFATIAEASVEKIKQATDGFARDFTNNLIDALATGELAFDDFAKSVLETIAKIVLNEIFTRFFSAIASPLLGSIGLGTGTVSALPSPDGVTRGGPEVPQSFMVGTPMFTMPTKSNRSPVTVNVMNYGNDDVEIEERNSGNGIEIDVLIKNTVRNGLADGSFDRVLATSFGSRRLGY